MLVALDTNESSHRIRQRPTPESLQHRTLTCERGWLSVVGAPPHQRLGDWQPWLARRGPWGVTAGGWPAPSSFAQVHPLLARLRLSATAPGALGRRRTVLRGAVCEQTVLSVSLSIFCLWKLWKVEML